MKTSSRCKIWAWNLQNGEQDATRADASLAWLEDTAGKSLSAISLENDCCRSGVTHYSVCSHVWSAIDLRRMCGSCFRMETFGLLSMTESRFFAHCVVKNANAL